MRKRHELPYGVICEKCGTHCNKEEYITILHKKPIVEDTTGRSKMIDRFNLCNSCYSKYIEVIKTFHRG